MQNNNNIEFETQNYSDSNISWQKSIDFQSQQTSQLSDRIGQNKLGIAKELPQKSTIFCIDDSPTIQLILKNILSKAGYRVIGNTKPLQSLTILLKSKKPDLIFMDIKMPGLEGYNLLQLIKRSRKLKDIPVIMLTSQTQPFDRVRAKLLGATGYITKPFTARDLIVQVQETLANKTEQKITSGSVVAK